MSSLDTITNILGNSVRPTFQAIEKEKRDRLVSIIQRPDLNATYNEKSDAITLRTAYGTVRLDGSNPETIRNVYVSGQEYSVRGEGVEVIEALAGGYDDVRSVLDEPIGRRALGRRTRRGRNRRPEEIPLEEVQETAYNDLSRAGLTYSNLFHELGGVLQNPNAEVSDVMSDLLAHNVPEEDIAKHLIYDSEYKNEIMARMYNYRVDEVDRKFNFETVQADNETFVGKLVTALGKKEARYDREEGVLEFDERVMGKDIKRKITNLPYVDEKGIFHNKNTSYIPHDIVYFAEGEGTRMDRIRFLDPVERAINGVRLEYDLTTHGDVKFETILDVTRNLPDFDNHPYGDEILSTLKGKGVISARYRESNSLLAEHMGQADELGAVALTMLDDDAEGIIDPYGTSNGKNLGMVIYRTADSVINADGSVTPGVEKFSEVGKILDEYGAGKDNFNRQQMSFNAMLTSLDVSKQTVFVGEFGMWNSEDAAVMMNDLGKNYKTGDKIQDFHGNKSTVSVVLSDLTDEEIAERHLEYGKKFAELNPHVDIVTSPASLASRLNMGIIHEGVGSKRQDVTLPDGSVVKDGAIELMYMKLPQTAEAKSKDYEMDVGSRRYSTLLRYALSSKVGDLYKEGLLSEDVRNANIDEAASVFYRLGISFHDDSKLIEEGNVKLYADAPVTVSMDDYQHAAPAAIRLALMSEMDGGNAINIDLGDIAITSKITGEAITDSDGRNVLPIRIPEGETIPYRYMEMFQQISRGNTNGIQNAYQKLSDVDYGRLVVKDNILKNIDTMKFEKGAKTTVIVPDPSIGLGDVRSNSKDDRLIVHRDPAIQSGNAISVNNVGGARPNVLHVNPLMINQVDGDFDGDTMGENDYSNLTLTDTQKEEFFQKSSVEEQVNYYGNVFLDIGGAHFKALSKVNDLPMDQFTFANGATNAEMIEMVEKQTKEILKSEKSYGAYAISFENVDTARQGLERLADDGIKGNKEEMVHRLENGYSDEDNRALAKALIAKSEWTGLAGAVTNNLIADLGEGNYDISRTAFDVTHSMTQAVLQMKKDAERLPEIDLKIKEMKKVMSGRYDIDKARTVLKETTDGLLPERAVDEFVDKVAAKQDPTANFGHGVINGNEMTTTKLSYISAQSFSKALEDLGERAQLEEELKGGAL